MNRYWRRPRKSTWFAVAVFLVSFGFWLTQPQPDPPVRYPSDNWVLVTTTTEPPPVDTVAPDTTVPPETVPPETVPEHTVPVDTVAPGDSVTSTAPSVTTTVVP